MNRSIGIVGCGWLGRALAERLVRNGDRVIGTTTSANNVAGLEAIGTEPLVVAFTPDVRGDIDGLRDLDAIVVAVPPGRGLDPSAQARAIARVIIDSRASHVVQISSTSVYPDTGGPVAENEADPDHRLSRVEDVYRELQQTVTVLRCAGLFGADRLILPFVLRSGRPVDEDARLNLVCQSDVVEAIVRILDDPVDDTFNICADAHPTKGEFYREIARCAGLGVPEFRAGEGSFKIVTNDRFKKRFAFEYEFPDPMLWGSRISRDLETRPATP